MNTTEPKYKYCRQCEEYRHKEAFQFFWDKRCANCKTKKLCLTCKTYQPKKSVYYNKCYTCRDTKICLACNQRRTQPHYAIEAPSTIWKDGFEYKMSKQEYTFCFECRITMQQNEKTTINEPNPKEN